MPKAHVHAASTWVLHMGFAPHALLHAQIYSRAVGVAVGARRDAGLCSAVVRDEVLASRCLVKLLLLLLLRIELLRMM